MKDYQKQHINEELATLESLINDLDESLGKGQALIKLEELRMWVSKVDFIETEEEILIIR